MGAWKKENDTPNRKKYLKRQLVELRSDVVLIQLRTGKIKVANSCPETCYTTKSIQHLLELSDLSYCVSRDTAFRASLKQNTLTVLISRQLELCSVRVK